MVDDVSTQPAVYDTTEHDSRQRPRLPSETRDLAPTPGGWAAILVTTGVLAWFIWRLGGDRSSGLWLVTSVVVGYFIAMMTWTAIRRELDKREDRAWISRSPPVT